jgi:RNA polymerase sigma-70 factor (ECF subfamily)
MNASMSDDADLLEAWRAGDTSAGERLFDRYFERVARFFYTKVDSGVDDLVQQTFLACVESRDRFRGDSSFFTFVIAIAKNILRAHYRKLQKQRRVVDFGLTSMRDLAPSPSTLARKHSQGRALLEALRRIPLDSQTVLELYFWEDMTAKEIGVALELPLGTVKSRIRRGKELLLEQLEQMEGEGKSLEQTGSGLEEWARSLKERVLDDPAG